MEKEKNLNHVLTAEELSKGGKASVEARRRKKTFREVFDALLAENIGESVPTPEAIANNKKVTVQEAIAITVAIKAVNGDLSAAGFVRDTLGEKPTDSVDLKSDNTITVNIKDLTDAGD